MLDKVKTLLGYQLDSLDGDIGNVKEFYFDDQHWAIRYLVADTGNWLAGQQVLISPYALSAVHKDTHHITVQLTKKQIADSPPLDSDKPVSRQFEEVYHGYYQYPTYWPGPFMWGAYPYPFMTGTYPDVGGELETTSDTTQVKKTWDHHLRSTHAVTGHHIQAVDGEIGHVEDFIIDDQTWAIRYLVIDTRNWWPGKKVLIAPKWIERVSWQEGKVFVDLSREAMQKSPEYTPEFLLNRDHEAELHRHYQRRAYWLDEPVGNPQAALQGAK